MLSNYQMFLCYLDLDLEIIEVLESLFSFEILHRWVAFEMIKCQPFSLVDLSLVNHNRADKASGQTRIR